MAVMGWFKKEQKRKKRGEKGKRPKDPYFILGQR